MAQIIKEDISETDERFDDINDDDDDDMPEAISFNKGKEEALKSISDALQDLRREKWKVKERRRERDRFLKEQKKKKICLGNTHLPAELLDRLANKEREEKDELRDESPELQENKKLQDFSGDDDEEDADKGIYEDEIEEDSKIRVITHSKVPHHSPHQAALSFLQKQLYGPRVPRVSMATYVSQRRKRLGKPAMSFISKKPQAAHKKSQKETRNVTAD